MAAVTEDIHRDWDVGHHRGRAAGRSWQVLSLTPSRAGKDDVREAMRPPRPWMFDPPTTSFDGPAAKGHRRAGDDGEGHPAVAPSSRGEALGRCIAISSRMTIADPVLERSPPFGSVAARWASTAAAWRVATRPAWTGDAHASVLATADAVAERAATPASARAPRRPAGPRQGYRGGQGRGQDAGAGSKRPPGASMPSRTSPGPTS